MRPAILVTLCLTIAACDPARATDQRTDERQPAEHAEKRGSDQGSRAPVAGTEDDRGDTTASDLDLRGKVAQGGLVFGRAPAGTKRAILAGRPIRVAADGTFLIGFAYDAPERQTLRVVTPAGETLTHVFDVEQRSFPDEVINGLPEHEIEIQDPSRRRELAAARKRIAKARSRYTTKPYYREGLSWPARGKITSTYGRKRIYDGEEGDRHYGVDIAVAAGTPVRAPAGGVIRFAERNVPLSGGLIILDHGHGLSSSFLHLSEIDVQEGEEIEKGQVLGKSGKSGRATGPHLDWRLNLFQVPIDPQLVVGMVFGKN